MAYELVDVKIERRKIASLKRFFADGRSLEGELSEEPVREPEQDGRIFGRILEHLGKVYCRYMGPDYLK